CFDLGYAVSTRWSRHSGRVRLCACLYTARLGLSVVHVPGSLGVVAVVGAELVFVSGITFLDRTEQRHTRRNLRRRGSLSRAHGTSTKCRLLVLSGPRLRLGGGDHNCCFSTGVCPCAARRGCSRRRVAGDAALFCGRGFFLLGTPRRLPLHYR